ncbi:MAG: copper chaperone PCu(A)C, partial [Burkholderiales bacterium]|nr:copper chaperone PCu(A)C [Burkholderiales bacterium]
AKDAHKHDDKIVHGSLVIHHPWARATASPAIKNSAAFLVVENKGATPDRLLGVSGDVAQKLELHTMVREAGVMRMREVPAFDIPAGGKLELKPGGLHIMLIGLKQPLKEGERFPLTLKFEKAGEVKVQVLAEKGHHHHGHDHKH